MQTPANVLDALQPLEAVEGYSAAAAFLQMPEPRLSKVEHGRVTVRDIHSVWSYRFERMQKQIIRHIPGLEYLVGTLAQMPAGMILNMVYCDNEDGAVICWFDVETGIACGFVVLKHTAASQA